MDAPEGPDARRDEAWTAWCPPASLILASDSGRRDERSGGRPPGAWSASRRRDGGRRWGRRVIRRRGRAVLNLRPHDVRNPPGDRPLPGSATRAHERLRAGPGHRPQRGASGAGDWPVTWSARTSSGPTRTPLFGQLWWILDPLLQMAVYIVLVHDHLQAARRRTTRCSSSPRSCPGSGSRPTLNDATLSVTGRQA